MAKLDDMMRGAGANIAESMGATRMQGGAFVSSGGPSTAGIPVRLQGVVKSKNAVEIPLDKIDRDPGQPREEFDGESLERLAKSLRTRGQLQPIRVRWDEGRGVYVVVVGERRWRAARMASMATLSCVVMEGPIEPGELLAIQLVENAVREDLKPIEQARAYRALMERNGWTARQVAHELAIDHSNVVRSVALLKLPEPIRASVESGEIPASTGYELSRVEDPAEQARLGDAAASGRLRRDELKQRNRKQAKGRGAKKVTSRVFRTEAGPRITIEHKRGLDAAATLAALREATRAVEAEMGATGDQAAA